MKFVLAPDSFKNCMRAPEVAAELARGIREAAPEAKIVEIPLSDGGEGFAAAAAAAGGGRLEYLDTVDPLGRPIRAGYARFTPEATVWLELAAAAGLELLSGRERAPLTASTYGFGRMTAELLKQGCRKFVLGLGGSATTDGGIGFAQALGIRFFDRNGRELPPGAGGSALSTVARIDRSGALPELADACWTIASDVTNPLFGPEGAASVFAPQKGADPAQVAELDSALRHWSALWNDPGRSPGDGAAGGIGFLLRQLTGSPARSGAELLLDLADFEERAAGAAAVITGEGRTDSQSLHGKLCGAVARRSKRIGVRCILVSGAIAPELAEHTGDYAALFSIAAGPGPLEAALAAAPANLRRTGRNLASLLSPAPGNGAETIRGHQ